MSKTAAAGRSARVTRGGSSNEELLESGRIVERPDHCQVEPVPVDQVAGDALDVLDGHLVELRHDRLDVGCPALEHLTAQPEHDQSLRRLELEDETSLREAL